MIQNISFQIKKNLLRNRDWPNGVKPTDDNMHRSEDHIYVEKQNNTIFILIKEKAKEHNFHIQFLPALKHFFHPSQIAK